MAYVPPKFQDPLLAGVGRLYGKFAKSARRRARINLLYYMPERQKQSANIVLLIKCLTAAQPLMMMAELCFRDPKKVLQCVHWHGLDILDGLQQQERNVILLVPHAWSIDIPASVARRAKL